MRFRQMATYRGVPYEVGVGPSESDVVLFAACPPPEELGFEPAPGHWRKRVIRAEVDVLWESRPIGTFHGEACLVLDDLGDRLHIVYLGKDARRARELGFWPVDRGVFELLTPRDEVTSLTEEKVEKNLSRIRPEPVSAPLPSYPYGAQPWSAAPAPAPTPAPADARGRDYPAEPALAPAGAWTGNGAPQWNGSGTGGHPVPGGYAGPPSGYAPPGGPDGWAGPGPGTGPQPPVGGYGAPAGPGNWTGHGGPGWTGPGTPGAPAWTGNGTGGPAPHRTGTRQPAAPRRATTGPAHHPQRATTGPAHHPQRATTGPAHHRRAAGTATAHRRAGPATAGPSRRAGPATARPG